MICLKVIVWCLISRMFNTDWGVVLLASIFSNGMVSSGTSNSNFDCSYDPNRKTSLHSKYCTLATTFVYEWSITCHYLIWFFEQFLEDSQNILCSSLLQAQHLLWVSVSTYRFRSWAIFFKWEPHHPSILLFLSLHFSVMLYYHKLPSIFTSESSISGYNSPMFLWNGGEGTKVVSFQLFVELAFSCSSDSFQ